MIPENGKRKRRARHSPGALKGSICILQGKSHLPEALRQGGGLIGGAALKPDQFVDIINAANQE